MNEENENQNLCASCGATLEEGQEVYHVNGDDYCNDCYYDNFRVCDICGDTVDSDDSIYISRDDRIVCESCADDHYNLCDDCNEYFDLESEGACIYNGAVVCGDCLDNYYYCENCGEYYPEDRIVFYEGDSYCHDCYDEYCEEESDEFRVYRYHEFRDWTLFETEKERDKKPPYYIGFELEIQPKNHGAEDRQRALKTIYSNLKAVCAEDGSLGSGGFEIISHPLSYNYIMENSETISKVLTELIECGYTSHDNSQCGLHFHVTRPENPDVIDRIWCILETYKNQIILLSRRTQNQIDSWAKFLSDYYINKNTNNLKTLYYIKKTDKKPVRYLALNNQNEKTIEFRFFKGTLKDSTFFACIEFINNLMTLCGNMNIAIESITWDKLCAGKYIAQYVKDKNIIADFAPTDNSLDIIKAENSAKILIEKINNSFMTYGRKLLNNGKSIEIKNIKTLKDMYNKTNELYRYYDNIRDNYFSAIYYLNEYYNRLEYKDYISQSKMILSRYINDETLIKNVNSNIEKLQKLYNRGIL